MDGVNIFLEIFGTLIPIVYGNVTNINPWGRLSHCSNV